MSKKVLNSSKPIRMWIDGKCFNLTQFKGQSKKGSKSSCSDSVAECDEDQVNSDEININLNENGKMCIKFELPSLYYSKLKHNDFFDLDAIRNQTNTSITVPNRFKTDKLIISGDNENDVKIALYEVLSVIGQIRSKSKALQFIAIPLISDEIKSNFEIFKNKVLEDKDTSGLEESIFISGLKLHLTIDVFVLLNDKEKEEAKQALQEYGRDILKPLLEKSGPLKIHVAGIECMNNNYKQVDVLYAKAKIVNETDEISLQKIANNLSKYFYEKGLLKNYTENVRLHMTLINTKYRNKEQNSPKKKWTKRISLDATKIMEKYKDYDFGSCDFNTIHISNMSSMGEDGFYQNLSSIFV